MVLWHILVLSNIAPRKTNMPLKLIHPFQETNPPFSGAYSCLLQGGALVDPLVLLAPCQPSDIQDMESIASAYTTAIHCAF